RRTTLNLEHLEHRYAPATLLGPSKLSYQDKDGDKATVTFSKPILNAGNVNDVFKFDVGDAKSGNAAKQQLQKIILKDVAGAAGTKITVKATKANGGDGFANVGEINADFLDLDAVFIQGDLGRIRAGHGNSATSGLKGLTVQSLGLFGLNTGA